jgi:DNA-binding GntR family transcriptional regulator
MSNMPRMVTSSEFAPAISRTSLNTQVYNILSRALLEGRLRPRQRLKIRDLAAILEVSETPVREAVMQLVRERALVLQTSRSLTVPRLSAVQYLELRRIRLELEGLAAKEAATRMTRRDLTRLEALNTKMLRAERDDTAAAVRLNWNFHAEIYRAAEMPELFNLIQGLWLRTGPLLTFQYPHAPPTYPGRHRHLDILDALGRGDGMAVRQAVSDDTTEGGAGLLQLLTELDSGQRDEAYLNAETPGPEALAQLLQ